MKRPRPGYFAPPGRFFGGPPLGDTPLGDTPLGGTVLRTVSPHTTTPGSESRATIPGRSPSRNAAAIQTPSPQPIPRQLRRVSLLLLALLGCAALALAAAQPTANPPFSNQPANQPDPTTPTDPTSPRFGSVDIFLDSGDTPLAVYQIELRATTGDIRIVGVEGSDAPAFAEPPHYDPAALQDGERIVLGAFSTQPDLPLGKTRLARVHLRLVGPPPTLALSLTVAGDANADPIDATPSFTTTFQTQNGSNP